MRQYNSYHTILKQLAKRESLPDEYLKIVDRSTVWRWKQEGTDKYLGSELGKIEVLEEFISRKESEKIMRIYLKLAF
jgi:hypothetical protein